MSTLRVLAESLGSKLGNCPVCLRLAIHGSLVSGIALCMVPQRWKPIRYSVLSSCITFSLIAMSHIVAFLIRIVHVLQPLDLGRVATAHHALRLLVVFSASSKGTSPARATRATGDVAR